MEKAVHQLTVAVQPRLVPMPVAFGVYPVIYITKKELDPWDFQRILFGALLPPLIRLRAL
mgnify:CR=1 FL=1